MRVHLRAPDQPTGTARRPPYRNPRWIAALAALAFGFSQPAVSALTELKHFDRDLAAAGVSRDYTDSGMSALLELTREEVTALRARAAASTGKDREQLEAMAEAVAGALDRLAGIAGSVDLGAREAAYPALKSLLYSVRSELRGPRKGGRLGILFAVLGNLFLKVPYLSADERARPLTPEEAKLEAANLEDPKSGRTYPDPGELAGLSANEVSRLDVRGDNYLWYTEAELERLKADGRTAWDALESRIENRVSDEIHAPYSLDRSRRVLTIKHIGSTATSPKIDAVDLYDQEWKVKWGEEVQTEPIANRFYVELGGRFADLVYANRGGFSDLVLVLEDPHEDVSIQGSECDHVSTFDTLKRCLLRSKYKFDVSSYVVGHGVISEELLRREPFELLPREKSKLVGREYVIFNESLVEFETGAGQFDRLGGGPMSSGGALQDRVKRSLFLLAYWIQNKDAKDANNHGVIDRSTSTYFEYMHDMGASLGALEISGNPNLLKVGTAYLRRRERSVKFTANMLYVPKAFDHATYADAVWMARKIVGLSREEIVAAVADSKWPDFQQTIMVSRLIARRNDIAAAFDVGEPLAYEVAPESVPLSTPADRLAAVQRYGLAIATLGDEPNAVAALEEFMRACGISIQDGIADFTDQVTVWATRRNDRGAGKLLATNDCKKSVVVAWLEQTIHPSGLWRRVRRRADDKPLEICQPTPRTLQLR